MRPLKGTRKVQGLILELPQQEEVLWSGKAFKKMVNLKILIIRKVVFSKAPKGLPNSLIVLEWENYPTSSLPSNFYGSELLVLRLTNAPQNMQLQEPLMTFQNITCLYILDCEALKEVPDFSAVPNLTHLAIGGCPNLVKIHDSVGFLEKLIFLTIVNCLELKELPACNQLKSLEALDISGSRRLKILAVAPKPLRLFIFYDAISFFQSARGCGLIQELMDCHYSTVYCISGARIPRCFRFRNNTNSICFWDRRCDDANFSFVDPTIAQIDPLSSSDLDLLWNKIMCLNVPSHVKRFVWTTISNSLPSSISLHVMKEWAWAKEVWLLSPLELRVDLVEANDSSKWMLNMVSILDIGSLELFMVIAWGLWEEWDIFCMGYKTEDPTNLIRRMCVLLEDHRISQRPRSQDIYVQTNEETASDQPSTPTVGEAIEVQQCSVVEIDGEIMRKNNIAACLEWLCFGK